MDVNSQYHFWGVRFLATGEDLKKMGYLKKSAPQNV